MILALGQDPAEKARLCIPASLGDVCPKTCGICNLFNQKELAAGMTMTSPPHPYLGLRSTSMKDLYIAAHQHSSDQNTVIVHEPKHPWTQHSADHDSQLADHDSQLSLERARYTQ